MNPRHGGKILKILVTGTAGFIGFHLADKLTQKGYEVIGLDVINSYYDQKVKFGRLNNSGILENKIKYNHLVSSEKKSNYKFIQLDLEDKENLFELCKKENFNAVCNLAAQAGVRYSIENPQAYINSNIVGFLNILEACRTFNISNLSYASSSSVYGLNEEFPFSTSSNVDHPISLYAASKKSNELMAHTYSQLYGIQSTGLRFFTVYGPWGRPDMALFIFTKAALEGKPIKVFNNGDMLRDFTYIDDIVEGISRVIDNPAKPDDKWNGKDPRPSTSSASYKIYNIGNNNPVKLMEFIEAIETKLGIEIKKEFLPLQPGDVPATYADVSDLVNDLNYMPSTSIEEGISNFIDWYKNFYNY